MKTRLHPNCIDLVHLHKPDSFHRRTVTDCSQDTNHINIQLHFRCGSTDHFFPAFFAAVLALVICFFHPKHWLQAMSCNKDLRQQSIFLEPTRTLRGGWKTAEKK